MTVIAQKIYDAWEKEWLKQKDFYEHRALAAALCELVVQLQYYQCCRDQDIEDMVLDSHAILDVAEELEENEKVV